ncbi:MAG TPA: (deoxy)nucleoside triphosphate pyrophosphohydrolase [Bryobacteraceae bacterium]|nr:(deoxy)nucleoside triphosphate pyrophosphohydrolase [Bryobacteraceae bacterium]
MTSPLTVVAAVIERDGKVLVCRRRADAPRHPLKWEFPGGKVEPGEAPRAALARELDEELGIHAVIGDEIASFPYQYAGRAPILLKFFRVHEYDGAMENREFAEVVWEAKERLPAYDFLEGDVAFVRQLAAVR